MVIKDILMRSWMSQYTENAKHEGITHPLSQIGRHNRIPISYAFTWGSTPQGYDYWARINNYENGA